MEGHCVMGQNYDHSFVSRVSERWLLEYNVEHVSASKPERCNSARIGLMVKEAEGNTRRALLFSCLQEFVHKTHKHCRRLLSCLFFVLFWFSWYGPVDEDTKPVGLPSFTCKISTLCSPIGRSRYGSKSSRNCPCKPTGFRSIMGSLCI